MQIDEYNDLETLFLALADKTRLRLLTLMADGPVPVGVLVDKTGENQPKVSRHLAYLRNCGVVTTTREGKWIYYSIEPDVDGVVGNMLKAVIGTLSGKRPAPSMRTLADDPQPSSARRVRYQPEYVETEVPYVPPDEFDELPGSPREPERREPDEEMDVFLL